MKPSINEPSQEYLTENYSYIDSGDLIKGGLEKINRKPHWTGYIYLRMGKNKYAIHRLIYIYHKGKIPEGLSIDHIDGDKNNNCIENLRAVTHSENMQNKKTSKKSIVKLVGVTKVKGKKSKQFAAQIGHNGKHCYIGYYNCPIEANAAYRLAKKDLHKYKDHTTVNHQQ